MKSPLRKGKLGENQGHKMVHLLNYFFEMASLPKGLPYCEVWMQSDFILDGDFLRYDTYREGKTNEIWWRKV